MSNALYRRFFVSAAFLTWLVPMPAGSETIKIGGTGAALGTMEIFAEDLQKSQSGFDLQIVPGLGSGGAKKAVLRGAINIAVTTKKALSWDDLVPTAGTIADGSYGHFKPFYMVASPKPSETAEKFIAFVLSPQGSKILTRLGHWVLKAPVGDNPWTR